MPRILPPTPEHLALAADRIRTGGVVAFPTETVYGLGAQTFSAGAIERVYQLKGRPFDNPLIAHVADVSQAKILVHDWNDAADALAERFWPGPLTLVLRKSDSVPERATAGLQTIAIRSPAHDIARELLRRVAGPISAPSANRSGHVSPTSAAHVADDFSDEPDLLIVDGGASDVGIESTVLDLTTTPPRVLRPGTITADDIHRVIGEVAQPELSRQDVSPGTAAMHYAPRTTAELVSSSELKKRLSESAQPVAVLTFQPQMIRPPHLAIGMSRDPQQYARDLYRALREADGLRCAKILIEAPPLDSERWRAIYDRLRRATARNKD